jgi:hypothetical protein
MKLLLYISVFGLGLYSHGKDTGKILEWMPTGIRLHLELPRAFDWIKFESIDAVAGQTS